MRKLWQRIPFAWTAVLRSARAGVFVTMRRLLRVIRRQPPVTSHHVRPLPRNPIRPAAQNVVKL